MVPRSSEDMSCETTVTWAAEPSPEQQDKTMEGIKQFSPRNFPPPVGGNDLAHCAVSTTV